MNYGADINNIDNDKMTPLAYSSVELLKKLNLTEGIIHTNLSKNTEDFK